VNIASKLIFGFSIGFLEKFIRNPINHRMKRFSKRKRLTLIETGRKPIFTANRFVDTLKIARGQAVTVKGVIRFLI
jgi:hypothetical protein